MNKYFIEVHIGYVGCDMTDVIEAESLDAAYEDAHMLAWEHYESYAGVNGIYDVEDAIEDFKLSEERDPTDEEASEWYANMVEQSIEWYVEPYVPEKHDPFL